VKPCYAVQDGAILTVFKDRLEAAIAYWQARPGSVLVYKAYGNWGREAKRSTRWLRVALTSSAGAASLGKISGEISGAAAPVGGQA